MNSFSYLLHQYEQLLRRKLNNNSVFVIIENDKIRTEIYMPSRLYEGRQVYYDNWKKVYNPEALSDEIMLMYTFGATE
jgi:hypothetical protein